MINSVTQDSESERSSDLAVALGRLTVDDDPSAVFSDGTGSSSESSHGHSSSIQVLRRERLNQFLRICGKEECVTGQPKKRWGDMDEQRKSVYVHRATTAIVAALEVIAPEDLDTYGKLCNLHARLKRRWEYLNISRPKENTLKPSLKRTNMQLAGTPADRS